MTIELEIHRKLNRAVRMVKDASRFGVLSGLEDAIDLLEAVEAAIVEDYRHRDTDGKAPKEPAP